MDLERLRRAEECSVVYEDEVLWTRCMTCGAPLIKPSKKIRAACAGRVRCFWRYYRNRVAIEWAAYRGR